jgi:chemosensory pili system protein ChpA (sensor histidine kinase/response regulator)
MTKTRTILYAEDDVVVLTAYRNRLQQEGFRVLPAKDGLEAIKFLSTSTPDLVVLDLMLPKFSGEEVLKFIRVNPRLKTLPVIILSTNSIIEAEHEPMLEGASKRLIKDHCNVAMLLEAIREALTGTPAKNASRPASPIRRSFSTVLETAAA